jgi:RecA-family ATPase
LQRCVAGVAGLQWFGMTPRKGPCVYLSEDLDELNRRVEDIAASYGVDLDDLSDLHLISLAGEDAVLATPNRTGLIVETPVWRGLMARIEEFNPVLVAVDTAAHVYAGDEIKRPQVRQFIGQLRRPAIQRDLAVLLLSHPSQTGITSGTGTSGSTGWSNSVRSRIYLDKPKTSGGEEIDADLRIFSIKKANYGAVGLTPRLRWQAGCFVLDQQAGDFDTLAADARAERVFFDLLADLVGQGRDLSPNRSPFLRTHHLRQASVRQWHPQPRLRRRNGAAAKRRPHPCRIETFGSPSRQYKRLVFTQRKEDA